MTSEATSSSSSDESSSTCGTSRVAAPDSGPLPHTRLTSGGHTRRANRAKHGLDFFLNIPDMQCARYLKGTNCGSEPSSILRRIAKPMSTDDGEAEEEAEGDAAYRLDASAVPAAAGLSARDQATRTDLPCSSQRKMHEKREGEI